MKLSGGERQLLILAMATLHQPKMILFDEPFTGLSPQNIKFISHNLKMVNQEKGTTMVIVEHHVKESTKIAGKIIGLKLGRFFTEIAINGDFDIAMLHSLFV